MSEGNGTLNTFAVLTVLFTVVLVVGADLSGFAGWLLAAIVGAVGAVICIGAWAIGKNLSK